jgi:hypothetical protein
VDFYLDAPYIVHFKVIGHMCTKIHTHIHCCHLMHDSVCVCVGARTHVFRERERERVSELVAHLPGK